MCTERELFEQLSKLRDSVTVIVGVGNVLKGDDGAGPIVCQRLRDAGICAELIDAGSVPENYIQPIIKKAPQNLLVIDAVDFGAPAGTINILKPEQLSSFAFSTHTLSPRLFIDMVCRDIKVDVYFVGIQPAHTQVGQTISVQVSEAIQQLTQAFIEVFSQSK